MVRSQYYSLRKLDRVNYSDKTNQRYTTTKRSTKNKLQSKKNTKKRTTAKRVSKKPMTLKNKKLVEENCKKKKGLEQKLIQLFSRLNKQSLDSDLVAIGYLFNCLFTNNPESISYDLEKIRRYINSKKTSEPKGNLLWENLKSLYFSAATF